MRHKSNVVSAKGECICCEREYISQYNKLNPEYEAYCPACISHKEEAKKKNGK